MRVFEVKKLIGDGFMQPTCVLHVSNTRFELKITLTGFATEISK